MSLEQKPGLTVEVKLPTPTLEFPLHAAQVCNILGVSKSTLLRWEKEKRIPPIPLSWGGNLLAERRYEPPQLVAILQTMQKIELRDGRSRYLWLKDFDPTKSGIITTPTGYQIVFSSPQVQ